MGSRLASSGRSLLAAALLLLAAPSGAAASPERHGQEAPVQLASTDTVHQASCPRPRPPVKLDVQPQGDGRLQVTVTAGVGTLYVLVFGAMQNAHVEIPGSSRIVTSNAEIPVPPGLTSWTFIIVSDAVVPAGTPAPAVTIPLTVFDGCGLDHPWRTFAGGGFNALVSAIEIGDGQVTESNAGTTTVSLPVRLTMPSRSPVTVAYTTANGTAAAAADFIAASGVITFAPGETQKTIQIQTIGDFNPEADETLTVTLSNPSNAILRRSVATVKIGNDDTAPTASGDAYAATAGQTLSVAAGAGLLANDQPGTQSPRIVSFGGLDAGGDVTTFPVGSTATLPGGGSLIVHADGSFNFTPASGLTGSVSFRYRARSLSGQSDATVIISVTAGPVANDDQEYAVTPPAVLTVAAPGLMGNDLAGTPPVSIVQFGGLDAGGALGTSTATSAGVVRDLGNGGSLRVNADGSFAFTAPSNAGGPFRFQYRLQNSVGFDDATVTIHVGRAPAITTTTGATGFAEGGSPVVVDPGLTVTQPGGSNLTSATVTITNSLNAGQEALAANVGATGIAAHFSGTTLTLSNSSSLANYQQVLRSVTYVNTASAPTAANRSISFQVSDGTLASNTASKTVSIGLVNDAPAGADKTVGTVEDGAYTFTAADFGFADPNDAPANQLLAVKVASLPAVGGLTNDGAAVAVGQAIPVADITGGRFKFAPAANRHGTLYATFTFQVQDDGGTTGGADTDPSPNTITVNVASVNDAPAGADKTVSTFQGASYTFATADFGFADPSDTPANQLLAVKIASLPGAGSLTNNGVAVTANQLVPVVDIANGRLQFTPAPCATGLPYASFTFQVQDDGGIVSGGVDTDPTPDTITVDVAEGGSPPVGGAPAVITTCETTTFISKGGEVVVDDGVTVSDSDGSTLAWATITITNVKNGSAESLDVDLRGLDGITRSSSRVDGAFTLTLTGPAPLATFQAALRRVTYNNNAHDLNLDNRVIQFQVNDGTNSSNQAFKTVLVRDNR